MLRLRPRTTKLTIQMTTATPHTVKLRLYILRKWKFFPCMKFFEKPVEKVRFSHLSLLMRFSKTRRVRKTAVKNEMMIPMIHVVAKPRIGPVPVTRRMTPVMSEVRLESKMAEKALL